ncbi:pantothenate synthetase [Draconibacterium orientale]|uniref:Pantothenate synthetase n=1 Tax=Draconibacterium orientale TaxID=1168034 RepID=X5D980_9BACT|nr:pantoate--beta-alanine ligase [Draconibacterium orientale]AHW59308.1 pantoate--beta-alanine ligase [Draconibacterium orientale]SET84345.1 pantothenate synthetase [Draconibacterium orientale]
MKLVSTIQELQTEIQHLANGKTVGFVPTMGALHAGHISLVKQAVLENPVVVVSIFVNPTQFNDPADLERYPRTLENDMKLLELTGCSIVFAPNAKEVYPEPDKRKFNFGKLEKVMEGKHRPGHFNGVAQVVSRLFDMVKPTKAYFGLKDFQQLAIVKNMVKQLQLPVEIVPCAIIREKSGLAMSSRNELLTEEQRKNATVISETLFKAKELKGQKSVQEITDWVTETINKNPFLDVEYFEIVDDEQLQPVKSWDEKSTKVGCVAVFCGKIRLIDNIVF